MLETRITPASFFIGVEGSVVDSHGNAVEQFTDNGASSWTNTLAKIGADSSYLFKKGDTLSFDSNGNGKVDAGERVLLKMKGGAGVFFLNTDNENTEIAAISASDKFGAELNGVVGGIVTSLVKLGSGKSTLYDFTTQVQAADIKGLLIDGHMGSGAGIWAGGDISMVAITGFDESTHVSAFDLRAGSAASNAVIGEVPFARYVAKFGEAGACISKVYAAGSIQFINAGDGGGGDEEGLRKNGGSGGFIKDITLESARGEIYILAGSAGYSERGKSGSGGSISDVDISDVLATIIDINAGNADEGFLGAGKGGSLSQVNLSGGDVEYLRLSAGGGGGSARSATPGGDVEYVFADISHIGSLGVSAGSGGMGMYYGETAPNISGGAGGSISNVAVLYPEELADLRFESVNTVDSVSMLGGDGGEGWGSGSGGKGGSISDVYVPVTHSISLKGGPGGSSDDHGGEIKKYGFGGAGGSVSSIGALLKVPLESDGLAIVDISGGNAGDGGKGSGGSVSEILVASREVGASSVKISAGKGSVGYDGSGHAGGNGGNLAETLIFLPEVNSVKITAGRGGMGAEGESYPQGGAGGAGGFVNTAWVFSYDADVVEIKAGNAGYGSGSGAGGHGGYVNDVTLSGLFDDQADSGIFGQVTIWAGNGGSVNAGEDLKVRGGNGGNLTNVVGPTFNTFKDLDLEFGGGGWGSRENLSGRDGKYGEIWI